MENQCFFSFEVENKCLNFIQINLSPWNFNVLKHVTQISSYADYKLNFCLYNQHCCKQHDDRRSKSVHSPRNLTTMNNWIDYLKFGRRDSDSLRPGRSGNWIPAWARFSRVVHTDLEAQPASRTMDDGSFSGGEAARSVAGHPPPPSAEFTNGLELYHCLSSVSA
jgi:hypothetical protein